MYGANCNCRGSLLLFKSIAVAVHELIYATSRVNNFLLAREEGVRVARNVELDERIFVAIFPYDGVLRIGSRTRFESEVRRNVLENHFAIVWVDAFLHG